MTHHPFLNPQCRDDFLHAYRLRRDILQTIKDTLPHMSGRLLDVGCGEMPYQELVLPHIDEYVGLDLEDYPLYQEIEPDATWDGATMPFESASFDCALCTEVLEHCEDPDHVLKEVHRVLKPGGFFVLTVPFLWPLHEVPHDENRPTPFRLERQLRSAGFTEIRLKAHGGWDASLAQMLGLWVQFRSMGAKKRRWMQRLLAPIVRLLNRIDQKPQTFENHVMMTGLSGTARKK